MITVKIANSTQDTIKEWALERLKSAYNDLNEDEYEEAYGVCIDFDVDVTEYQDFDFLLTNEKSRARDEFNAEILRDLQFQDQ